MFFLLLILFFLILLYNFSCFKKSEEKEDEKKLRKISKTILQNCNTNKSKDQWAREGIHKLPFITFTTSPEGTFTKNKRHITICNEKELSNEIKIYSLLHELSHAINKESVNHDQSFIYTFQELLNAAEQEKYLKSNKIEQFRNQAVCGTSL